MKTMPTRISGELFEAAKASGEMHSRSAAQQLDHWARIGRELESSPAVALGEITRVLAGEASYDDLPERSQAVVRADWNEQIAARLAALDFGPALRDSGLPWVEGDEAGNVVMHNGGRDDA